MPSIPLEGTLCINKDAVIFAPAVRENLSNIVLEIKYTSLGVDPFALSYI
jgi:hypothetical protein